MSEEEECPETVRSSRSPLIDVVSATSVEAVLIQSLDLALTELSECRLFCEELMANLVEKENALREAHGLISILRQANEDIYNGLVMQKTQFQTILANKDMNVPEAAS